MLRVTLGEKSLFSSGVARFASLPLCAFGLRLVERWCQGFGFGQLCVFCARKGQFYNLFCRLLVCLSESPHWCRHGHELLVWDGWVGGWINGWMDGWLVGYKVSEGVSVREARWRERERGWMSVCSAGFMWL